MKNYLSLWNKFSTVHSIFIKMLSRKICYFDSSQNFIPHTSATIEFHLTNMNSGTSFLLFIYGHSFGLEEAIVYNCVHSRQNLSKSKLSILHTSQFELS